MKKRIWITKDWRLSACITIWFKKPIWIQNLKKPCEKDSGHWSNSDGSGLAGSQSLSWQSFDGLFKVHFEKKVKQGFIAERIISVNCAGK
jgi:hypothetical protein